MHSIRPSRGRILFEVLCALTVSASCAGAWLQTGASALLPAAVVALLYGMVHVFDMRRPTPVEVVEPQRIDFKAETESDLAIDQAWVEPLAFADPRPETGEDLEVPAPVEEAAPRAVKARRAKAPRKGGARRAKAPEEAKLAELVHPEEAEVSEAEPPAEVDFAEIAPPAEPDHPRIEPLFEPEPHFRQTRAAFGRRHTIR